LSMAAPMKPELMKYFRAARKGRTVDVIAFEAPRVVSREDEPAQMVGYFTVRGDGVALVGEELSIETPAERDGRLMLLVVPCAIVRRFHGVTHEVRWESSGECRYEELPDTPTIIKRI
jgi:hypothetical protein